jgi:hypothetical protein
MKRSIRKTIATATVAAAVLIAAAGAPLTHDLTHGLASRLQYDPDRLTALPENPQVRYEQGGADYARAVAALLPAAAARIMSIHGRRFARPATVGVYVSLETFRAATGFGNSRPLPVAGTFLNHVMLSPELFAAQRQRLPLILPHELSHAHLQSWMSPRAYARLPNWFQEGLGVMVADGGGAESVGEAEARQAIRRGDRILIGDAAFERNSPIMFVKPPAVPDTLPRIRMAYRQAGLFVAFMHDGNPAGFVRMMAAVLDNRPFKEAVTAGYGSSLDALWSDFLRTNDGLSE